MKRKNKTKRDADHSFVIDLHGVRAETARIQLDRELNAQFMRRATGGRVICGHGKGVLLRVIGEELAKHPLIASHERAPNGLASYVVQLVEFDPEVA
jgi:DNA-nicking Smr family endonuclease